MYGCVYRITCRVNGKIYVGATKYLPRDRLAGHFGEARCGSSLDHPFYSDIRKYGKSNFNVDVIRYRSTKAESLASERFYIRKLNTLAPNGYNILLGHLSTPEVSRKRSAGVKRWWGDMTPEERAAHGRKIAAGQKGWRYGLTPEQHPTTI